MDADSIGGFSEVSICIITYNQESYIKDTIEGALMQKGINFHIIIADDHSTDNTIEICRQYKTKYPDLITIIEQPSNKGIIKNTEDCFLAAISPIIALCEGDDYWTDPYKLKDQVEILNNNADVSLVHTNWIDWFIDEDRKEIHVAPSNCHMCNDENLINNTISIIEGNSNPIRFSSVCFRREDLQKAISKHHLFNETFSTVDLAFFLEFSQLGKFYFIDRPTTVYRLHSGSVSITGNSESQTKFSIGVMRIYDYYLEIFNIPFEIRHRRLHKSFSEIYPYALKKRKKELATELSAIEKLHKYPFSPLNFICKIGLKNKFLYQFSKAMLNMTQRLMGQ